MDELRSREVSGYLSESAEHEKEKIDTCMEQRRVRERYCTHSRVGESTSPPLSTPQPRPPSPASLPRTLGS